MYNGFKKLKNNFINGGNINAIDDNGWTLLMWISFLNYPQLIDNIIYVGGSINMQDNMLGKSALMIACTHNNYYVVKKLISNGANINQTDFAGFTALMYACNSGCLDIVKELCKYLSKEEILYKEPFGYDAIMLADSYEEYEIVYYFRHILRI
jgi:ankyrin repeat protein